MEILILISIFLLAFISEYIDSSLGMGYGTMMAPILIIAGFEPLIVIPAILFSQALAGSSAAFFHYKYKNIDLNLKGDDIKIAFFIIALGLLAIVIAVFLAINISENYLENYIGIVVLIMGIILLAQKRFRFSLKKICFIGIISVFNKAITGGGFGPILTSGQIISGGETKKSIGLTTLTEAPICIFSFIAYVILNGMNDFSLLFLLSLGAVIATPFGPLKTKYLDESHGRFIIGFFTLFLGLFIINKNFIWPYISSFILNPFFWALISMFALIGSSVTLVSKKLGYFTSINIFLVVIFILGRIILVLPYCPQPRFEIFNLHLPIGGIIFIVGLIFLTPLIQIKPWPKPDSDIHLITKGFYSITRNPIYLGEILWSIGWAIMFRSIIGLSLIPIWWGGYLFHVILEEEYLERRLGNYYIKYKKRVRGRIFPYLPI